MSSVGASITHSYWLGGGMCLCLTSFHLPLCYWPFTSNDKEVFEGVTGRQWECRFSKVILQHFVVICRRLICILFLLPPARPTWWTLMGHVQGLQSGQSPTWNAKDTSDPTAFKLQAETERRWLEEEPLSLQLCRSSLPSLRHRSKPHISSTKVRVTAVLPPVPGQLEVSSHWGP